MRGVTRILRRGEPSAPDAGALEPQRTLAPATPAFDIALDDPIVAYFQRASGAVDIENLELDSPALRALRAAGVKLVVPLVSQGELIGVLNLGARLSEQEYSGDDRRLLDNLAAHAAPAVRVAQLVRQQQAEARERESIAQELRIAHLIQQTLLPKQLPRMDGWRVGAYYQPARAVGGDFYDFIELADDQVGIVIGDASSKGVPAALVMATTRTMLRASAQRLLAPADVLRRTNEVLCTDIPPNMFVTCLYAVLNPANGELRFANAGHNLPYVRTVDGVVELRATGWPLGLMPGVDYEEKVVTVAPHSSLLLFSDGLTEAHDAQREMFGTPRVISLMGLADSGSALIDRLLLELEHFTDSNQEQEDDITLVTLERVRSPFELDGASGANGASAAALPAHALSAEDTLIGPGDARAQLLAEFDIPSEPGNERRAITLVENAVQGLELPLAQLERLKTAVGEATMNAIEHGNQNRAELPVVVRVLATETNLAVQIRDQGGSRAIPSNPQTPDLEAKLAGLQSPRGWGLFLIKNMVDEMHVASDDRHHTVELIVNRMRPGTLKETGDGHDDL
jgi:serine phosphatase RsbU (regulator of sigma subunit)/anti-sigma regulatory factor (Ser/Thr protein kinase)